MLSIYGCGSEMGGLSPKDLPIASILSLHNDPKSEQQLLRFNQTDEITNGKAKRGSYIVAFKQTEPRSGLFFPSAESRLRFHRNWLSLITRRSIGVSKIRYLASLSLSKPGQSFLWQAPQVGVKNFLPLRDRIGPEDFNEAHISVVDFKDEYEARDTLKLWLRSGLIWYAEPNYRSKLFGETEQAVIDGFDNPSSFPAYKQIQLIDAMTYLNDEDIKANPVIAVLDSGIDVQHPALVSQMYVNEEGQNRLCRNDTYGCNTSEPEGDFLGSGNAFPASTGGYGQSCGNNKDCMHGTHVAGLVAGFGSDEFTGVCPYCKILNVRVGAVEGDGLVISDAAIVGGLSYVSGFQRLGQPLVRVINASFGKFQRSRSVEIFVRALKGFANGVMVIAAAGNENTIRRAYPAAFSDAVAVANIDSASYRKSPSSNFGVWVDIAAPGDGPCSLGSAGMPSSIPGGGALCMPGTSMASPVVAGVAGLILALEPNLSFNALKDRLLRASEATNIYRSGINDDYRPIIEGNQSTPLLGSGVVNALNSVNPSRPKDPPASLGVTERVAGGCASIATSTQSNSDRDLRSDQRGASLWVFLVMLIIGPWLYILMRRFTAF